MMNGSLGLTRLAGFGAPEVITSPVLQCSEKSDHTFASHSASILSQLPSHLRDSPLVYPAAAEYATTNDVHISRHVSVIAESLYNESPTTLNGMISAMDESHALHFESSAELYHHMRVEHLDALTAERRAAAVTRLPTLKESMRTRCLGSTISDSTLSSCIEAKLKADTATRCDELRSLCPPADHDGNVRNHHLAADDNDVLAKACQVDGSFPNRKLHLIASAQTGMIVSATLIPDASFESKRQPTADVISQHGAPSIFSLDNLPTNAKDYQWLMPATRLMQDLKHYESRIKNAGNSYAPKIGAAEQEAQRDVPFCA